MQQYLTLLQQWKQDETTYPNICMTGENQPPTLFYSYYKRVIDSIEKGSKGNTGKNHHSHPWFSPEFKL
jgi:hypothetical protein